MPRTMPECPVCAASVLRQREGGQTSTWDLADRLERVRQQLERDGALDAGAGATLAVAVSCLRIAEFREE
jgi:hypothetical protein